MVYKFIRYFFSIFFFINILSAQIIYNKKDISISSIELEEYKRIYNINYGYTPSNNESIKNLVLIKKVISYYEENDKDILKLLDQKINIKREDPNSIFELNRDFLRILVLKNEFILKFYREDFEKEDLERVISNLEGLNFPISNDGCLTINKFENLNNDHFFINNLYENLMNNTNNYTTQIDSNIYNVCIDSKTYSIIEKAIISHIETLTKNEFESFLYDKL